MLPGMKRLLPVFLVLPLSGHDPGVEHAADDDLIYGVEVLTGYRSEYIDRGFKLANDVVEVQVNAELVLDDHWTLDLGAWYGTETGSESFDQITGFLGLAYDAESWQAGMDAAYSSYSHRVFEDGVRIGPFINWFWGDDWRIGAAMDYDTGADGYYAQVDGTWTQPTGEDSFLSITGGLSATSDFYSRSGLNDIFGRISWSYHINRHVAVTPFGGTSVALDSGGENRFFAGVWFEVNF